MIVDFDDFAEDNHRLDLLERLRDANPKFRCTLFAIPGKGSADFWGRVPEWCELAVHGWSHPHPRECARWSRDSIEYVLDHPIVTEFFVKGWKSPGWQSSDAVYEALYDRGWWIAEHWENIGRLPIGMQSHVIQPDYRYGGDHWHGHIGNVCGNGIEETFPTLLERVTEADSFELISEVVTPWRP